MARSRSMSGEAAPAPSLPRLAVTMGDPAGIGPEICLRLLGDPELAGICRPVVFGDVSVMRAVATATGIRFAEAGVRDLRVISPADFAPGLAGAATGRAAFAYVEAAIDAVLAGEVDAVTTAPLCKEALHMAGIDFPGHTEIFAARTRAPRSCMMQYSEEITCSFVTVHVGYGDVPALLSTRRILDVIELTVDALRKIRGGDPRIVVCGLNPHAGEHGLFGNGEEEAVIAPAVEQARAAGLRVEGPVPPDTAFLPWKRVETDAYVCMYHDQGHIPVKALAFDSAVNTTLGLPVIRTSVDHGTAFDIAWQGKARPHSLFAAARLAARLCAAR